MTQIPDTDELARHYLERDGPLDDEEQRVLESFRTRRQTSRDAADLAEDSATFGDHMADRVAAVGGSWGFILVFTAILIGWMVVNTGILGRLGLAFDPYPYIFLNLMLSTVAAIQAPIIMMSQNRQGKKDRLAASHDYEVNLRAELEIMRLHDKIDLLHQQNGKLIEALGSKSA